MLYLHASALQTACRSCCLSVLCTWTWPFCRKVWAAAAAKVAAPVQLIPSAADAQPIQAVLTRQASVLSAILYGRPSGFLVSQTASRHIPVWSPWSGCDESGARFLATHGVDGHLMVLDCQAGSGLHLTTSLSHEPAEVPYEASAGTAWEWMGQNLLVSCANMPGKVQAFLVREIGAAMSSGKGPSMVWPVDEESSMYVCTRVRVLS